MGFYIRKSVRVGLVRFNVSKSGVGVSAGIPGLRLGTGPRGAYIHAGRGGLYYRANLAAGKRTGPIKPARGATTPSPIPNSDGLTGISSAPADTIQDQSSEGVLSEIRARRSQTASAPLMACAFIIAAIATAWTGHPLWSVALAVGIPAVTAANIADHNRRTTVLMYDMEDDAKEAFQKLHDAFGDLQRCARVWSVDASGATNNYKYNGGATQLLRRHQAKLTFAEPDGIKTNVSILCILLGKESLYFFPERVFIVGADGLGAVSYTQLEARASTTRFIEDGPVPRDGYVVDRTWKYLNKNGTPDRRFSHNPQLPILAYAELFLASKTGLRAYLLTSSNSAASAFIAALGELGKVYRDSPERHTVIHA